MAALIYLRIGDDLKRRWAALCRAQGRSESEVGRELIEAAVEGRIDPTRRRRGRRVISSTEAKIEEVEAKIAELQAQAAELARAVEAVALQRQSAEDAVPAKAHE